MLDRYYPSNAAYQGSEGLDPAGIIRLNETFAPRPDLVLLLDVEPKVGISRIRSRGDYPNTFEKEETLSRCREIFLLMLERPEFRKIDATASADQVLAQAMEQFVVAFTKKIHAMYGLSVKAAESLRPLLQGAFSTSAHA